MASLDLEYLRLLVTRFKAYKSPTDAQRLIVMLGDKDNRNDDENKQLGVLLKAEKQAERLTKARNEARDVLKKINDDKNKAETRKKIIWGGALRKAANDNETLRKNMDWLFHNGYISDRDKDVVRDDLMHSHNDTN